MMNIAGQVRSTVWVGEIQVRHKQFRERMGGVMELGDMQFGGRKCEVTKGGMQQFKGGWRYK